MKIPQKVQGWASETGFDEEAALPLSVEMQTESKLQRNPPKIIKRPAHSVPDATMIRGEMKAVPEKAEIIGYDIPSKCKMIRAYKVQWLCLHSLISNCAGKNVIIMTPSD